MTTDRKKLENDRAALAVLLRLAEFAREHDNGTLPRAPYTILGCFEDGAGAVEPDAVVAWVRGELQALDFTLDALD